jgi:hypothetical protein
MFIAILFRKKMANNARKSISYCDYNSSTYAVHLWIPSPIQKVMVVKQWHHCEKTQENQQWPKEPKQKEEA